MLARSEIRHGSGAIAAAYSMLCNSPTHRFLIGLVLMFGGSVWFWGGLFGPIRPLFVPYWAPIKPLLTTNGPYWARIGSPIYGPEALVHNIEYTAAMVPDPCIGYFQ